MAGQDSLGFSPTSPAPAQGDQLTVRDLNMLMRHLSAATQAASAAAQAEASSFSAQAVTGKDLSKVSKPPEKFNPNGRDSELSLWLHWSWQFEQWLSCISLQEILLRSSVTLNASWSCPDPQP